MADTQLPLFYRKVVPLSRERHKGWYIDSDQGYSFAAKTNSIFLAASEFGVAAREFPILFAKTADQGVAPIALLGLRKDENLFVDDAGNWLGEYIPAYIRRYPFIVAAQTATSETFTVCIDESYSGFNTANEGERLITEDGEHGEQLGASVKFLRDFHQHTLLTNAFCDAIVQAELLDTVSANVALNSGEKLSLTGLLCVSGQRLRALSAEKLKELLDNGFLDLIYVHMHSLASLERLIRLAGAEQADPTAETG